MSEENRLKIRKRNIKLIIAAAVILAFIIFLLTDTGKPKLLCYHATMLPYRITEEFKRRICDAFPLIARVFSILC